METPFNPYWFLDQRKLIRGIFLNQNKQNLKTGKQTNRERPIGQNNLIQNKIEIWEREIWSFAMTKGIGVVSFIYILGILELGFWVMGLVNC